MDHDIALHHTTEYSNENEWTSALCNIIIKSHNVKLNKRSRTQRILNDSIHTVNIAQNTWRSIMLNSKLYVYLEGEEWE